MADDPGPLVRRAEVHTLADGSPRHRAQEVAYALDSMRNDSDKVVRLVRSEQFLVATTGPVVSTPCDPPVTDRTGMDYDVGCQRP